MKKKRISIKGIFDEWDLRICPHLLNKSLVKSFIFV